MNGLNGIIKDGAVYEIEKGECNPTCAFYHDAKECEYWRKYCDLHDCYFRFSQSLTDKINEK